MKKILNAILIVSALWGLAAMAGSDYPGLTDTESYINLTIGAAMFFGSAGVFTLIKRRGK